MTRGGNPYHELLSRLDGFLSIVNQYSRYHAYKKSSELKTMQ